MSRSIYALALVVAFFAASTVCAHESRPGYLEAREVAPGRYEVLWKQPAVGDLVLRLNPVFPETCELIGADRQLVPGALATRLTLSCPGGLAGKTIQFSGLADTITNVLVRTTTRRSGGDPPVTRPFRM